MREYALRNIHHLAPFPPQTQQTNTLLVFYAKSTTHSLCVPIVPLGLHLPHVPNSKFTDFATYARHALTLLRLSEAVTDADIARCWDAHSGDYHKVCATWALKGALLWPSVCAWVYVCVCVWLTARLPLAALLAPCTESLVLIDRLLFFRERNISASLTPLFDKRLSPRNFVLVAKR